MEEARKFKYTVWVTYKNLDGEGTSQTKIEFEAESQEPKVVERARKKAIREHLSGPQFDITEWTLFDEDSRIVDRKVIECANQGGV